MNSPTSWRLVLAVSALLAGGCASSATGVTIEPFAGRPDAQVRADSERCTEEASREAETARARTYAACVLAKGHRVTMPFQVGVEHARLTVRAPAGRSVAVITTDLAACENTASATRPRAGDVVAGRYGGVLSRGDTTQVGPHTTQAPALANQLATCLGRRGYEAR